MSSATIFSVMDHLRGKEMDSCTPGDRGPKEYVVGCAFGPGIAVEMCMLKRNMGSRGLQTPPETESEGRSEDGDNADAVHAPGSKRINDEEFVVESLKDLELD